MLSGKFLFCVVLVAAWHEGEAGPLQFLRPSRIGDADIAEDVSAIQVPVEVIRTRVREGVPPPLCAERCVAPPTGPVCAFDAAGKSRTFATLCELEAISCRESTYYAITSLGEC